ncbi:MAG: single-stranded-DNA-specific exonuclease RecJ [Moraxella sp.]|nr:single-stranded-DNA-specific exonuclease RecJ [Moraxella sp.]
MTLSLQPYVTHTDFSQLADTLGSQTLARILAGRGVKSADELELFVSGLLAAEGLLGLSMAVAVIDEAIDAGSAILVVGDFDCDGATSTALVVRILREMGAVVDFLVPDRFVFGYGLTPKLVHHAKETHNLDLIITVDNGISSHEGVAVANSLGIQVVITDHHLTTEKNPDASAVVNPNQLGCTFASKSLVGVGVAFYVMGALAKSRRLAGKSTAMVSRYLDLVALGTVADVGVLDKNNRILVAYGLEKIKKGDCVAGILAILNQAGREAYQITQDDFGFVIAPRINAAGRMDNMRVGVECLLADDWREADKYAYELNRLNIERRSVEQAMKQTAEEMLDGLSFVTNETGAEKKRAVILYDDSWHQGVIGIVAGRIKERLYVPTLIFAPNNPDETGDEDFIKASARSIAGVHIRDAILKVAEKYPDLICHFGGHAMAAGLTLYKKNFEKFCTAFHEVMADYPESVFFEKKFTDGELPATEISLAFAERLKNLTIWGHGFMRPSFDGVFEVLSARVLKDKHLKLNLVLAGVQYPIDAIWFNYKKEMWDYRASRVHILYELDINEWQGNQSVQFVIKDLAVVAVA